MAFVIKRNDTLPTLKATLKEADGNAIDLTTAASIRFIATGDSYIEKTPAILDAAAGRLEVVWTVDDTTVSGVYTCEFEITWGTGLIQTVPNDGYFSFVITDDLG